MGRVSERDPAVTWDWLSGAVWLLFLAFPLVSIWLTDRDLPWQVALTGLVALFAVGYVATVKPVTELVSACRRDQARRIGWTGLLGLTVLALLLGWQLGPNAMTTFPFLLSVPVFFLPWRQVWAVSAVMLGLVVPLTLMAWGIWPSAMLWGIAVMVLGIVVLSRYADERREAHRATRSRLAVVEERERVARDVHDVLGHSLTVVTVKTELAQRLVDVDPGRAKAELAEVQQLSRQALAEIRATVGGLRVARLADEVAAAQGALAGAGIAADLPEDLSVVDPRHRITLAWVLREAVTNVVRHSRATRCGVELGPGSIVVTDDGRGARGRGEGNGIRGLRERVEQAGGRLHLGPGPDGTGTRLEVQL